MIKIITEASSIRLRAEGLAARRGEDLLFSDVSFELGSGDALVLTGRNGSGKSTLLRVVAGLLPADAGRVLWAGEGETIRACEACHYLGHRNAMKAELTVQENLSFWKSFLGNLHGGAGVSVAEAADRVGLGGIAHLPFGYLSAGQQRRMAFAKLLVAYRPVWILDEPTAALDARAEQTFTDLIKQHLAAGGMLLAATHQPLGLENAMELRMTGFADLPEAFVQ